MKEPSREARGKLECSNDSNRVEDSIDWLFLGISLGPTFSPGKGCMSMEYAHLLANAWHASTVTTYQLVSLS